ncbi:MAG: Rpp14/Pop5 family protein [Candidatus Micrarchaeia archaeon]|jgi:RNase P/RNase MRP subunit POP5
MKKSLQERKRYISFEVIGNPPDNFEKFIYEEFMKFFGEFGFSKISFKLIEYNSGRGIVKCKRDYKDKVIGFLSIINTPRIKTIKTSGTLKSLRKQR